VSSSYAQSVVVSPWHGMLSALRPHQWIKNVLVFVPMLAGHRFSIETLLASCLTLLVFCLVSSAGYLVNDLRDKDVDRNDPAKSHRPLARGVVSSSWALVVATMLAILAVVIAWHVSLGLVGIAVAYLAGSLAYSIVLKRMVLVDVFVLASFYVIRIVAGGVATGIPLSDWLLLFSMMLFLALALVKRYGELNDGARQMRLADANRGYEHSDAILLAAMAIGAEFSAITILGLYTSSDAVRQVYSHPNLLLLAAPVLVLWVSWMLLLAHRGRLQGDPIVVAASDPPSWVCMIALAAIFMAGY
jgi:4-hydroxybenzoate polyprenyltransferase